MYGFGEAQTSHLAVGIHLLGVVDHCLVLLHKLPLEGNIAQQTQVLAAQLPFATHERALDKQLEQA